MSGALEMVKDWTVGQLAALLYKIGEDNARAILRDELKISFVPSLVHGYFTSIEEQITRWREWLSDQRKPGPSLATAGFDDFIVKNPAPAWPDKKLTAVVLTLRGPSAAIEFDYYWPLIVVQQEANWKWDQFIFDDEHVRWHDGSENAAKDWRFEWQVIKLGVNRNTSTETVRKAVQTPLPNAGILAAAALNPQWVKSMNGDDVPFVDLPGYEVSVPGCHPWRVVPDLHFDRDLRQVKLYAYRCDCTFPQWGVPSLAGV